MSRREEITKLTETWNAAWNSKDPEQLAAMFHDDGTYYDPDLPGGAVPGKAGIKDNAAAVWSDWPAVAFEIVTQTIEDDRVVVEWRSNAQHRTGVELQLEGVDILQWSGDKLSSVRCYYDVHRRKKALGG